MYISTEPLKKNSIPRRRLALLVLILGLLTLILVQPARAGSGRVTVDRRDAVVDILSNGDVQFVETWEVQFSGAHDFTFAFRDIPLNKATGISGWGIREAGRDFVESSFEGEAYTYVIDSTLASEKITWYFPPTREASRTFQLSYTVQGSMGIYDDFDRFFWKFLEADRGYPIAASTVLLRLPENFTGTIEEIVTFVDGQEGQEGRKQSDREIVFERGWTDAGQEWEIGVRFSHGFLSAERQAWQQLEDAQGLITFSVLAISLIFFIGGLLLLYLIWYLLGRDQSPGVTAEFYPRPPEAISPALAGTLLDENAEMRDVLAALVDLARRGYLEIVEEEQAGFGKQGDFEFVKLKGVDKSLEPYEKELLKAIFHNQKSRSLSGLKNKFYKDLPDIQTALYKESVARGYFSARPDSIRRRYAGLGLAMTLVVGGITFCSFSILEQTSFLTFCAAVGLLAFPVGLIIISRWMPRKTQTGARAAEQWAGFKRYLEDIEKYTKLEEARDLFEEYLPFAIAFGLEKGFVSAFERVKAPVPTWYHPYGIPRSTRRQRYSGPSQAGGGRGQMPSLDSAAGQAFTGLSSMSTGFFTMLDSAASVFVSQPQSSSSGGGGGGFSGGGGGGGGSSGFG
jgi:hypothetical protein